MAEDASPSTNKKRVWTEPNSDESELNFDTPEAKRIRETLLLDILDDDSDEVPSGSNSNESTQDLDSVIKLFEEEISNSPPSAPKQLSSDPPSQPDLGYLLEASDDELGLPPAFSSSKDDREVFAAGSDQIWRFEDDIPSLGLGITDENNYNNDDVATFEGLFSYDDVFSNNGYGYQSDYSDLSWRPESLPAL